MDQFTILTVCTGNICRSPLAEQLLRSALADLPVRVHSAGTHALVGHGMPEPSLVIAGELGVIDAADHASQQLIAEHVKEADLILAMARDHRSQVVQFDPRATRRAFTVRELARIVGEVQDEDLNLDATASVPDRLRAAVQAATLNRGMALPAATPDGDDVIDPYRLTQDVYEESRDQLVDALGSVTQYFRRAIA